MGPSISCCRQLLHFLLNLQVYYTRNGVDPLDELLRHDHKHLDDVTRVVLSDQESFLFCIAALDKTDLAICQ